MRSMKLRLLAFIALEGIGFLFAPNVWSKRRLMGYGSGYLSTSVYRLEREGLIHRRKAAKGFILELTKEGKNFLEKKKAALSRDRSRSKKWDGKWRFLIFDIPEKSRKFRDEFRKTLKTLGFGMIQKSVWISPHNHDARMKKLINSSTLAEHIHFFTVEKIEPLSQEDVLIKAFDLETVQSTYEAFISFVEKTGKDLDGLVKDSLLTSDLVLWHQNELELEYESAISLDPFPPVELLPEDWPAPKAERSYKKLQKKLHKISRNL